MLGRMLAFVLCPALLAASGCARSDDGTVIVPSRMDVRRIWDKAPPGTTASRPVASDVFPQPPSPTASPSDRRHFRPASTKPSFQPDSPDTSSQQEKALACRNVSEPGKRYRVVCD
ncbi:MAG: hypothetical protein E5X49_12430 [Mesorhizobium sp.]|nr:MAG: hypothetical protein EOQ28_27270 [Mesorhizobium sp.]RWB99891.1 MAG: hypothetical protein EOQ57_17670 [Mesorhizobium sp.]RWG82136.1 MAG: hypothetical protein EOQ70_23525 [Mesorhizobium sp.]RWG83130.1 MAG: hypothetical protein EOQ69_14250 [Mesorhizobium sp.]RWK03396.1 MAG: hypothetical protein EOR42_18065 [Mesorhizobium sp.]